MEAKVIVTLADSQKLFTENSQEFKTLAIKLVKFSEKAKAAREEMAESLKPLGICFAVLAKRFAELATTPEWAGKELSEYVKSFLGYSKDQSLPAKGFEFGRVVLSEVMAETDYNACSNEALGLMYRILKAESWSKESAKVKAAVEICQKRADKYVKALRAVLDSTVPAEEKVTNAHEKISEIVSAHGVMILLAHISSIAQTTEKEEIALQILMGREVIENAFGSNLVEVEVERDGQKVKEKQPRFDLDKLQQKLHPIEEVKAAAESHQPETAAAA